MTKLIDITGKALSGEWGNEDESGNGIPVLRTTNFTNEGVVNFDNVITRVITKKNIKEKFLKNGDIILEKSGGSDKQPVGRVVYFEGPNDTYLFNNFTGLLRVKDQTKWFSKFVFYSLYSNYRKGGTIPFENKTTGLHNLKTDDYVARYEVVDLPYEEQQIIVGTLDKAKSIIESRKQELQILDDLVKARFVEMFGGIDNYVPLSDLCSMITDGTHQPPKFQEEGIPFIFVSNIAGNSVTYGTEKFISEETYKELYKRTPIEIGDILLSTVGSYGHPAVVTNNTKFLFQRHIAYLKPDKSKICSLYMHSALLSPSAQRQIEERVKGIAQKTLNLSEIRKIEIPVPKIEEQKVFETIVKQIDKSKFAVQKAIINASFLITQEVF